jgi:hypothetical protein
MTTGLRGDICMNNTWCYLLLEDVNGYKTKCLVFPRNVNAITKSPSLKLVRFIYGLDKLISKAHHSPVESKNIEMCFHFPDPSHD